MASSFQVICISSVVLYGSNETCKRTVICCMTHVSRPCHNNRHLSQNGNGGDGSRDGEKILSKPMQNLFENIFI